LAQARVVSASIRLSSAKKAGAVNLNPHTRNFWHKQGWFQPVLGLAVPKKPVL